ncbi:efflux RND transporter periplasmic adaptor subunit [Saccharococcus caldoxylosilyticus]|uniref:efflux RND transporter periplasmic adaptor subunit n=1 Tax=Saccharococcus caldoxylosilyticus TaxID=81408 RepID=UPI001FCC9B56|nr:efflux RND transporter periplasmic adaptor subunit [Parageobacillus caldoxylosilyticus]BDG37551.1 transporter [Parageobacillus caldoxylosilyticus]BDG41342.1 transporter [Parageobacillus caldoxylosilyticus]
MKRWKRYIFIVIVLCICANFYILFHAQSKIPKSVYVNERTKPEKTNIKETVHTTGMTVPTERKFIYYNPQLGAIDEILVTKGQEIQVGTPLIRYVDEEIDREIHRIARKKEQLNAQIEQLSKDIDDYTAMSSSVKEDSIEKMQWEEKAREAEREKTLLEWQMKEYEEQQHELTEKKDELIVESNTAGVVEEISYNKSKPLITIASPSAVVRGKVKEETIGKLAVGQTATVNVPNEHESFAGTIADIGKFPIKEASFQEKSEYPFTVQLNEQPKQLPFGYHVNITVVTKEKNGVITVPAEAVWHEKTKAFVYVIHNGKLEKRNVILGIKHGKKQEIEQGLRQNEYIVSHPTKQMKHGMDVIVPFEVEKPRKETIKQLSKWDIVKHFLDGFFRSFY